MTEAIQNLVVDNVEYPVNKFNAEIQKLLALRQQWTDEVETERASLVKTEAAIRQLDTELTAMVTKQVAEDPAFAPAEPKTPAKRKTKAK